MAKQKKKTRVRRGKRKKGLVLLKVILIAAVCTSALYGVREGWKRAKRTSFFHCTKVDVRGNALISGRQLRDHIPLEPPKSIFAYDVAAIADKVTEDPYVRTCVVRQRIPGKLVVDIEERTPVAYVRLKRMFLIDNEQVLLPLPTGGVVFDVPVITGVTSKPRNTGQVLDVPMIGTALDFITAMTEYNPRLLEKVSEIDLADPRMVRVLTIRPAMVIYLGADLGEEKLMKWDVLEQYNPERLSGIEYIDLRFKDQIIIKKRT